MLDNMVLGVVTMSHVLMHSVCLGRESSQLSEVNLSGESGPQRSCFIGQALDRRILFVLPSIMLCSLCSFSRISEFALCSYEECGSSNRETNTVLLYILD